MVSMEGLVGAGCCSRNHGNRHDGPQVVATLAGDAGKAKRVLHSLA